VTDGLDVVALNRLDQLADRDQSRPAAGAVAPRENELGVGKLRAFCGDALRMVLAKVADRGPFPVAKGTQQVLRLVLELVQVRPSRKAASGHDEPP